MIAQVWQRQLRSPLVKRALLRLPLVTELSSYLGIVDGQRVALQRTAELVAAGTEVELLMAVPPARTVRAAARAAASLRSLLEELGESGFASGVGVTVDPAAMGLELPERGQEQCLAQLVELAEIARAAGVRVTVRLSHPRQGEALVSMARALHASAPELWFELAAPLYRTEEDVRRLRALGGRIRLQRAWAGGDETSAYQRRVDADLSFVRCLRLLLEGGGQLAVAIGDERLLRVVRAMLLRHPGRPAEFVLGAVAGEYPARLAEAGHSTRSLVIFGPDRSAELVQRLLARPRLLWDFGLARLNSTKIAKD